MSRLFLALNLPDEAKDALAHLADKSGDIPGARWVDSENYHITLKFLGEVSSGHQTRVIQTLERLDDSILPLEMKGLGLFPLRGAPETLWVGVQPSPALLRLQRRIESTLVRSGFAAEARNYHPHVTMARLHELSEPGPIARFLASHALFSLPTFASSFSLYASQRTSEGSVYTEVERFHLYGVTGDEEDAAGNGEADDDGVG
jgi:RNA 2',3'-cyclic 3'-phosphodiesterase